MEFDGADSQDNVNCFRNCPLDFLTSHCKRPQKTFIKCEKKSVQVNSYDEKILNAECGTHSVFESRVYDVCNDCACI